MCECYGKLVRAYPTVKGIDEVFQRHLKVLSRFPEYDKPGLYFKIVDLVMDAYERLILVKDLDIKGSHRCEETDRLVSILVDADLQQCYMERQSVNRSPRLKKCVRRVLFKNL